MTVICRSHKICKLDCIHKTEHELNPHCEICVDFSLYDESLFPKCKNTEEIESWQLKQ